MTPTPETVALARMAGARIVRALAVSRVTGRAIVASLADSLARVTVDGLPPEAPQRAYGYDVDGTPTSSPLNTDTAIVVWATLAD
jgi:hypothetical protein